jgi:hypothetical protein
MPQMNSTFLLYEDRVSEIEFYYSIIIEIERGSQKIQTIDNARFQRILKSNFLLMLYNLVEACVASGLMAIYENVKNNGSSYTDFIDEIRLIWSNYEIGQVHTSGAGRQAYEKRVQAIINQVISSQPIILNKDTRRFGGNLDAKTIKELCDKHRIRYVASDDDGCLRMVKDKRNNLAHGDESFGDCARDMTLTDLEHIKDEVLRFIKGILDGMKEYYDNKYYLLESINNRRLPK